MRSNRLAAFVVLSGMAALVSGAADAVTYKWVDANGRVVYSDQPPPGNVKTETVAGAPPPSNPNAVKEMNAKEAELKKRQLDATETAKKAETQRADTVKRNEQCMRAQSNIKQLAAEQIGMVRQNAKGELVYVDDETRRKERAELETWVKQNCGGAN